MMVGRLFIKQICAVSRFTLVTGGLCLVALLPLTACKTVEIQPQVSPEIERAKRVRLLKAEAEHQRQMKRNLKQQRLERVLELADKALDQGRLTLPEADNAFDRYKAVQLLDPANKRADQGLKAVLIAYINLADGAIRSGRLKEALGFVQQAKTYFGDHTLLTEMRRRIVNAKPVVEKWATAAEVQSGERIDLPENALSRRSTEVKTLLQGVSERLMQSNESVMIHARNDAEGRWIYKVMMEASPGYRIRGDIRIGKAPALVFQPPL